MPTTPRSPRAPIVVLGLALVTAVSVACAPTNEALDENVVDGPIVPVPHVAHLRGIVIDFTTGQPIEGARVDIGVGFTTSASDGSYAIGNLRIQAGDLVTSKVGYDTARTFLGLPRGDTQFIVRLRAATLPALVDRP